MKKGNLKNRSLAWAVGISGLLLLPVEGFHISFYASQVAAQTVGTQLSQQQLEQLASSITVKIIVGKSGGSGTLIRKDGQVYTVLTNAHVLEGEKSYQVQTSDGQVYQAQSVKDVNFKGKDLALLQFSSKKDYPVASLGNLSTLKRGDEVFSSGFPFETNSSQGREFVFADGRVSEVLGRAFEGGYRIGYTSDVEKGMSGGPVLNREGKVIGINGIHAHPLWGNPYIYEDGSKPSDELRAQMERSSWAIAMETVAQLAPKFVVLDVSPQLTKVASTSAQSNNGLVNKVENIAKEIAVLITWETSNASGAIIGKEGNTYYVLTANHVAGDKDKNVVRNLKIVTHDGQTYQATRVKSWPGVDLALLQFTSNQNYQVVTLANYPPVLEDRLVFVTGWPDFKKPTAATLASNRSFSAGFLLGWSSSNNEVVEGKSLVKGIGLVYTNITDTGISGGPVLDTEGRLIGIHAATEGVQGTQPNPVPERTATEGVQGKQPNPVPEKTKQEPKLNIGFSLGIPVKTFLAQVDKDKLKLPLKQETSSPRQLTSTELDEIVSLSLNLKKPESGADPNEWLNYGNKLWRLRRYEEAQVAFEKAISLSPNFYEAWYGKGRALMLRKEYQEAVKSFEKISNFEKPDLSDVAFPRWNDFQFYALRQLSDAFYYLGKNEKSLKAIDEAIQIRRDDFVLYNWRATILEAMGRYPEALKASETAIELNPNNAESYIRRAQTLELISDYSGAFADVDKAIALQPDLAYAYSYRGVLRSQEEGFSKKETLADLNKAIELQPNDAGNYARRGSVYAKLGERQEFLEDFEQALRLLPDDAGIYQYRAQAYTELNETEKAIADYNTAMRLAPEMAYGFYMERGDISYDQDDYQGALADYTEAIRLNPQLVRAYLLRGKAYQEMKDQQKALQDFNQAINLQKQDSWVYIWRGDAYLKWGETEKGIKDYETAIKLTPDLAHWHYNSQGLTRHNLEDYQGAIADYSKAISLKPNEPVFYLNRGSSREAQEDYQGAITDYTEAIRLKPDYVTAYLRRGRTYAQLKDRQMALKDYEQAISLRPDSGLVYSWKAYAYYTWWEEPQQAIKEYNEAIRLSPQNAQLYRERAEVWASLWQVSEDKNAANEAIEDLSIAVSLQPNNSEFYWQLGSGKFKVKKDYQGAIADFTKAIELKPNYVESYQKRAEVKMIQKDYQGVIADYTEAIRLAPQNAETYNLRGNAYHAQEKYQEAIKDYTEAIRLKPDYAVAYFSRGNSYSQMKDYKTALTDYNEVIRLAPKYADAYGYRGLAKAQMGDKSGAIEDLQKMAQLFREQGNENGYQVVQTKIQEIQGGSVQNEPANQLNSEGVEAYLKRGLASYQRKDYQGAIADYTEAIRLAPQNADAYNFRGNVYSAQEKYREAIKDYTEAIRLEPKFAVAYFNRGLSKSKQKDYQGAIADYTEAIRLNPNDADFYFKRGDARDELEDYPSAISDYNEAIRLKPDYTKAYYYRGISKSKQKDYQGAIADYNQALTQLNYSGIGVLFVDHEGMTGMFIGEIFNNSPAAKNELKKGDQLLAINGKYTSNMTIEQVVKMIQNKEITQVTLRIKRENKNEFEVTLTKGLIINPESAPIYMSRGKTRRELKDFQGAKEDFELAANLYQQQNNTEMYQTALENLSKLPK